MTPEHYYQPAGTPGETMGDLLELARRATTRTGNPQMVHAHSLHQECTLDCRGVLVAGPPPSRFARLVDALIATLNRRTAA